MSPSMLRDAPQYLSGQLSSQSLSRRAASCPPRVQVKLWYDKVGHQLIVTILGAKDLPSREDGRPRNPYVKIYFLPDRSDKSKRRTKTVTLWDQARLREEESQFLGEILIELETALLDDEPHWYKLQTHDVSSVKLWYDKVGHQLIVTILGAKDLPSREDGRPRNPYVKIYFLPDRREFRERMLEVTLWDQARLREEESQFLGE
ncbi:hypothetical protein CRUP_004468, partial [Coryphaenoides rupestris]